MQYIQYNYKVVCIFWRLYCTQVSDSIHHCAASLSGDWRSRSRVALFLSIRDSRGLRLRRLFAVVEQSANWVKIQNIRDFGSAVRRIVLAVRLPVCAQVCLRWRPSSAALCSCTETRPSASTTWTGARSCRICRPTTTSTATRGSRARRRRRRPRRPQQVCSGCLCRSHRLSKHQPADSTRTTRRPRRRRSGWKWRTTRTASCAPASTSATRAVRDLLPFWLPLIANHQRRSRTPRADCPAGRRPSVNAVRYMTSLICVCLSTSIVHIYHCVTFNTWIWGQKLLS